MRLSDIRKSTIPLTELFYLALVNLLSEAFTGVDAKDAIVSGLSSRDERMWLNDPLIVAALIRAIQRSGGSSEEEIKKALIDALTEIFNEKRTPETAKQQMSFVQRPKADEVKQLYMKLVSTLHKSSV